MSVIPMLFGDSEKKLWINIFETRKFFFQKIIQKYLLIKDIWLIFKMKQNPYQLGRFE
jgi:hypothetical protein